MLARAVEAKKCHFKRFLSAPTSILASRVGRPNSAGSFPRSINRFKNKNFEEGIKCARTICLTIPSFLGDFGGFFYKLTVARATLSVHPMKLFKIARRKL